MGILEGQGIGHEWLSRAWAAQAATVSSGPRSWSDAARICKDTSESQLFLSVSHTDESFVTFLSRTFHGATGVPTRTRRKAPKPATAIRPCCVFKRRQR